MQIDVNSKEFIEELEKTKKFANKVVKQFNWEFNPDEEVVDRVLKGLANNKIKYGKRYCPCFVVKFDETDRVCPCKPAIEKEIPQDGVCHCGIFCTPEYANSLKDKEEKKEIKKIDGLDEKEIKAILEKDQILGEELEILLKARDENIVDFYLIDIREPFEYQMARIKQTDELLPVSRVNQDIDKWMEFKDKRIIIYCHVGSRSAYLQRALKEQLGFEKVGNLTYGIAAYYGEIEKGM